ncbi:PEP-CTERM/exosortase system-associated acyltransferase [Massilia consociata]|uniref:PEP-CTERM/exosortase system-associated acyltransferase n=1 Tax=Massilia consociata TaxID=760117 RepID=A0ABV6FBP5_9BURK
MSSIIQQHECDPVPAGFLARLVERFSGKRDVLIPYFNFRKVLKGNMDSYVLKEIYKLRYEVYCLERQYLEASDFKEELETDEYDDCSTHFAAYTLDQTIIGTVRLVQPHPGQAYPFQSHCTPFPEFAYPAPESAAEISRLVVKKTYRRRRGDTMEGISQDFMEKGSTKAIQPGSTVRRDKRNNSPLLLLGMYREMYRHSRQNGIRYWYAAMERSLARSLEKMGFKFVPIGPQVDYYGPVTPHMADLNELDERLKRENKFLAAWFNDEPIPLWILVKTMIGNFWGARTRKK